MSSNDHKKFKTDATQKTSTDTEIISDAIVLPPYSTDHILTVTAPSSTSGLTGQVDVELEMSPDGENWCPALTKETTAGGGGTSGVSEEDANLKAVSTRPDPGSTNTTATFTGNKFALGSLSYDASGNELTAGTGTRDFMHQFMSKDKPFNYSMWLKTDTANHPFQSGYTHTLFRHGGKDKFTNAKTVALTDNVTQNLCEPNLQYSNQYALTSVSSSSLFRALGTNTSKGIVGTNSTYNMANETVSFDRDWSFTARLFVPANTQGGINDYVNIFRQWGTASSALDRRFTFSILPYTGDNWRISLGSEQNTGVYGVPFYRYLTNGNIGARGNTTVDNWYVVGIAYTASTGINTYLIRESDNTVELNLTRGNNNSDIDWSNVTSLSSTRNGSYGPATAAVSGVKVDQYVFYDKALSLTEVQELTANNQINDPLATSFASNVISYRRFGDDQNDVFSTSTVDVMGNAQALTVTNGVFEDLSSGGSSGYVASNVSNNQSLFTATSSFSISGWFKTSGNDTGTLFSNTQGAATTGLKVDLSSSGITASYLGTANSTIVSANNLNDDEWHHIIMVMSPGSQLIVVDNIHSGTSGHPLTDSELKGDNKFTLLGDGQHNANAANPSATDSSKLNASLSNWSIHAEDISEEGIAQLYSNGHVRNIKNLPGVNANLIVSWWQLSDATNPEQDLIGDSDLQYVAQTGTVQNTKTLLGQTTTNSSEVDFTLNTPYNLISGDINNNTMPNKTDDWTISIWARAYYVDVNPVMLFRMGNSNGQIGIYYYNSAFYGYVKTQNSYATVNVNNTTSTEQSIILRSRDIGGTRTLELIPHGDTSSIQSIAFPADTGGWGESSGSVSFVEFSSRYVSIASGNVSRGGTRLQVSEASFFNTALSDANVATLGASGPNGGAGKAHTISSIQTYFRMGDGSNDAVSPAIKIYDDINYSANHYIQDTTSTTAGTVPSLVTTDRAYTAPSTVIGVATLSNDIVPATGATNIVEEDQYGSGITMTLTKRFNTTTNEWTDVHTHPTCVCLSFNGLEDQAEYFAIYTYNEIDVADNVWHNLILSFSGKEGGSTNATTNFSFSSTTYNFTLSIDGNSITEAHYVGGLGGSITNKSFAAQERHLKWDNNSEEDYMPHAQLNSNIFESTDQASKIHIPVKDRNYSTGFLGYADETSFHSESWFTASVSTFNEEKARTMFGSTSALSNRGVGTDFPARTPYPLRRPSVIGSSTSTSNQYIDPEKYDAGTNADGGLEAWWRWGDTTGDCTVNINDAIGFESGNTDTRRSLNLNSTYNSEPNSVTGDPEDLIVLSSSDPIYVPEGTSSTGSGSSISLVSVILENIQAGVCNLKNLTSPILQYIRIKYTNSGEAQLGDGKVETSIHYRRRRER